MWAFAVITAVAEVQSYYLRHSSQAKYEETPDDAWKKYQEQARINSISEAAKIRRSGMVGTCLLIALVMAIVNLIANAFGAGL